MFKPLNFLSVLIHFLPAILGGIWFQECTLNLWIFFKHLVLQRIAFLGKGLHGTLNAGALSETAGKKETEIINSLLLRDCVGHDNLVHKFG